MLVGNIGKQPVYFAPKSEVSKGLSRFSLAVDGGVDKDPMWINIKHFNKLNELIVGGSKVYVEGQLKEWKMDDKKGFEVFAGMHSNCKGDSKIESSLLVPRGQKSKTAEAEAEAV